MVREYFPTSTRRSLDISMLYTSRVRCWPWCSLLACSVWAVWQCWLVDRAYLCWPESFKECPVHSLSPCKRPETTRSEKQWEFIVCEGTCVCSSAPWLVGWWYNTLVTIQSSGLLSDSSFWALYSDWRWLRTALFFRSQKWLDNDYGSNDTLRIVPSPVWIPDLEFPLLENESVKGQLWSGIPWFFLVIPDLDDTCWHTAHGLDYSCTVVSSRDQATNAFRLGGAVAKAYALYSVLIDSGLLVGPSRAGSVEIFNDWHTITWTLGLKLRLFQCYYDWRSAEGTQS